MKYYFRLGWLRIRSLRLVVVRVLGGGRCPRQKREQLVRFNCDNCSTGRL